MRDDHLQPALQAEAHAHLRPHAQRAPGGAPGGWPARPAPRRSATRVLARRAATASGVRAACASKSAWMQRVRGIRRRPCGSTPPPPARARAASSSSSAERRSVRIRRDLLQQPRAGAPASARRWRGRTGPCCTSSAPRSPSGVAASASARSNLAVAPAPASTARTAQAAGSGSGLRRRRSAGRTAPGRAARGSALRSGCSSATSCSNGTSWCSYAPSVAVAHAAQQLAEGWDRRARSVRSTSVLTKKPISPSVSARVRPAMGLPTTTSSLPA